MGRGKGYRGVGDGVSCASGRAIRGPQVAVTDGAAPTTGRDHTGPDELLDALGWGEGDVLEIYAVHKQIVFRKVEDGTRVLLEKSFILKLRVF